MMVIPESRADLASGTAERVIMNEKDTLTYSRGMIKISRGRFSAERVGNMEVVSTTIQTLYVSNRIEVQRAFQFSAQGYFQGYGKCVV